MMLLLFLHPCSVLGVGHGLTYVENGKKPLFWLSRITENYHQDKSSLSLTVLADNPLQHWLSAVRDKVTVIMSSLQSRKAQILPEVLSLAL